MRVGLSCLVLATAGCVSGPAASPLAKSVEVEMSLESGRPAVLATLSGTPMRVVFDTGSQGAVIAKTLAEQLKLQVVGEARLGSPGGGAPITAQVVSLGSLAIDGLAASTVDAVVVDDARLPAGTKVILSTSQFATAVAEFDFTRGRLRLSTAPASDNGSWQPLDERGLLLGSLQLGDQTVPLHIDSGNPGLLDLPASMAGKPPLTGPLRETKGVRLVDRELKRSVTWVDAEAIVVGVPIRLRGEVGFLDMPSANLGARGLRQAVLTVDTPRRRWRLAFLGATLGAE
jgi:Aspartyl protease